MYLYKKAMELSEQQFSTYSSVAQAPQYTREKKKKKLRSPTPQLHIQ